LIPIIELLVKSKIEINQTDHAGHTILTIARNQKHSPEIIDLLIKNGAR